MSYPVPQGRARHPRAERERTRRVGALHSGFREHQSRTGLAYNMVQKRKGLRCNEIFEAAYADGVMPPPLTGPAFIVDEVGRYSGLDERAKVAISYVAMGLYDWAGHKEAHPAIRAAFAVSEARNEYFVGRQRDVLCTPAPGIWEDGRGWFDATQQQCFEDDGGEWSCVCRPLCRPTMPDARRVIPGRLSAALSCGLADEPTAWSFKSDSRHFFDALRPPLAAMVLSADILSSLAFFPSVGCSYCGLSSAARCLSTLMPRSRIISGPECYVTDWGTATTSGALQPTDALILNIPGPRLLSAAVTLMDDTLTATEVVQEISRGFAAIHRIAYVKTLVDAAQKQLKGSGTLICLGDTEDGAYHAASRYLRATGLFEPQPIAGVDTTVRPTLVRYSEKEAAWGGPVLPEATPRLLSVWRRRT